MRKKERILRTQELIIAQGEVYVSELAKRFSVSEVTVRNDLDEMEQQGKLERMHGGAKLKDSVESTFFPRSMLRREITEFSADKIHIAQLTLEIIPEREWIFLGCGDTCAAIADALKDRKVNVVTNSILAAAILTQNHNADVCLTGGTLSGYDRHFLAGDVFLQSMRNLRVKLAFFGASGAEYEAGFSCSSTYERGVYEAVRKVADTVVFVLGSEKFGVTSFTSIAPLGSADLVLSDEGMPLKYQRHFAGLGVPIAISAKGPPPAYLPKEGLG